ncbi:hypothetical protein ACB094_01G111200 [Castanea mollissima]
MSSARIRETVSESLFEALSSSHEVQQKVLEMLVSITKVSPQNRNLLAQTDGAIPALLTLSKSSSSIIQSLSVSTLFNISLNPDLKRSLADMETIYHLNSMILSPSSPETSRLTSSLVCSLAMLDKNKAKFAVAGTIQLPIKALSGPRSLASHHLLSSLAELVHIVDSTDGEDLAGTSLVVLCHLARFDEGLNALRKIDHVVSLMVNVLKWRCMLNKEGAAEILLRLFDESEGYMTDALIEPDFSTVLADLSVRGSAKAREKTALLMEKVMEANMDS